MTQAEAALLLGQCERSYCRYIGRYEADGLDGLLASDSARSPRAGHVWPKLTLSCRPSNARDDEQLVEQIRDWHRKHRWRYGRGT